MHFELKIANANENLRVPKPDGLQLYRWACRDSGCPELDPKLVDSEKPAYHPLGGYDNAKNLHARVDGKNFRHDPDPGAERGYVSVHWARVELTPQEAAQAGCLYEESASAEVMVDDETLLSYLRREAEVQRDPKTGEVRRVYFPVRLDVDRLIKDWLQAGAPPRM